MKNMVSLLNEFKKIGLTSFDGVTRCVYDENWLAAQKKYIQIAGDYGLYTFVDDIGNIYATTEKNLGQKVFILSGSHMDTVINGGPLDGVYGTLASLISIGTLMKKFGHPKIPLVAVSFSEEEGSRFNTAFTGSRYLMNKLEDTVYGLRDHEGLSFNHARQNAVTQLKKLASELNGIGPMICAFIELHIEQGPILERKNQEIGIVTDIVGQKKILIKCYGVANHAGTTPMNMRCDAMKKAVTLINKLYEVLDGFVELRYTIGQIQVQPNVPNVIPSEVNFSLDLRHKSQKRLDDAFTAVKELTELNDSILTIMTDVNAIKLSDQLKNNSALAAQYHNSAYQSLISGAGHDAQIIAKYVPTTMIFVPSIKGKSHSPSENTKSEHLVNGQLVLQQALYQLAYGRGRL